MVFKSNSCFSFASWVLCTSTPSIRLFASHDRVELIDCSLLPARAHELVPLPVFLPRNLLSFFLPRLTDAVLSWLAPQCRAPTYLVTVIRSHSWLFTRQLGALARFGACFSACFTPGAGDPYPLRKDFWPCRPILIVTVFGPPSVPAFLAPHRRNLQWSSLSLMPTSRVSDIT